jgi:hypothetical protein
MPSEADRKTVTFEELTYSNMLTLNALIELLAEKGVVGKQEILDRVKQLQAPRGSQTSDPRPGGRALLDPRARADEFGPD